MNSMKWLRSEAKLTTRKLSEYTGVNIGLISQYENGLVPLSMNAARRFSEFFSTDIEYLVNGSGKFIMEDNTRLDEVEYMRVQDKVTLTIEDGRIVRRFKGKKSDITRIKPMNELESLCRRLSDDDLQLLIQVARRLGKE